MMDLKQYIEEALENITKHYTLANITVQNIVRQPKCAVSKLRA